MIENKMDNSMELNEEQLEAVTGGRKKGASHGRIPYCIGPTYEHDFVKTGEHREEDVLPFGIGGWTYGQDVYLCKRCGIKVWSGSKP